MHGWFRGDSSCGRGEWGVGKMQSWGLGERISQASGSAQRPRAHGTARAPRHQHRVTAPVSGDTNGRHVARNPKR